MALVLKLQKRGISRELGYLKGSVVEPYKVLWCPFVEWCSIDWSSVGTWFGTCSAPGTRIKTLGLVYPLFLA